MLFPAQVKQYPHCHLRYISSLGQYPAGDEWLSRHGIVINYFPITKAENMNQIIFDTESI
jgi:hypothetical protein